MAGLIIFLTVCLAIESSHGVDPSIFYMYVDPNVPVTCEGESHHLFSVLEGFESLGSDETDYYFLTSAVDSKSPGPKEVNVHNPPTPSLAGDCVVTSSLVGDILENPGMLCQHLTLSTTPCGCGGILYFTVGGSFREDGVFRQVNLPPKNNNMNSSEGFWGKQIAFHGSVSDFVDSPQMFCANCPLQDVWVKLATPLITIDTGIVPYVLGDSVRPIEANGKKKALCHVNSGNMSSVINAAKMYEDGFRITSMVKGPDGDDLISGIISAGSNLIGTLIHILGGGILANGRYQFPRGSSEDAERNKQFENLETYLTTEHEPVKVPATFKKAVPLVGKLIIGTNLQTDKSTVQEWTVDDDPSAKLTPDNQGQIIDKPYGRAVLKIPVKADEHKEAEAVVVHDGKKFCFDADTNNLAIAPIGACGKHGVCEQHEFCNETPLEFVDMTIKQSDTDQIMACIDDAACPAEDLVDLMIKASELSDDDFWSDGRTTKKLVFGSFSIGTAAFFAVTAVIFFLVMHFSKCWKQGTCNPSNV